jgi:hypothetical protein
MLVPVGGLQRVLLAIACLGPVQLRPGSDLPQFRAGMVQWLTSRGIPAMEVLDVTLRQVKTY